MVVIRSSKNPIIKAEDVKPSSPDFKVICVFNCGVTRFNGEILLLMRLAEAPKCDSDDKILVPFLDETTNLSIESNFFKKTIPGKFCPDLKYFLGQMPALFEA